jgi:tetratricopeptide (TPR) repeat protein
MGEEVSEMTSGSRLAEMTPELSRLQEGAFGVPDVQVDIYEQMKRQINEVKKFLAQPAGVEQAKEEVKTTDEAKRRDEGFFAAAEAQRKTGHVATKKEGKQELTGSKELPLQLLPEGEAAEKSRILKELSEKEPMDKEVNSETTLGNKHPVTTPELSGLESAPSSGAERRTDVSAKAREILGEHKTFASFAEDKFNRHMRAAEEYLKRGRYYRAADAYTLASIYKPDDPLAYAGKSHALFAAGEYMSSALFLTRALEIFPEYAQFKIDLVAMVGDKDKLESRIANIEKWLDESDAAELQFLLGYIYYQMGRQAEAGEMINAAFEKMPESPAVAALKKAIAASE